MLSGEVVDFSSRGHFGDKEKSQIILRLNMIGDSFFQFFQNLIMRQLKFWWDLGNDVVFWKQHHDLRAKQPSNQNRSRKISFCWEIRLGWQRQLKDWIAQDDFFLPRDYLFSEDSERFGFGTRNWFLKVLRNNEQIWYPLSGSLFGAPFLRNVPFSPRTEREKQFIPRCLPCVDNF